MALRSTLDLNALRSFAAVKPPLSATAAAERLGVPKARVSLDVARLEAQLGAGLFNRTTRRTSLTEAGAALLRDGLEPLRGLEAALAAVGAADPKQAGLAGTLRIAATAEQSAHSLGPAVAQFAALHPALQIELRGSDRVADLVQEGIDLAIRVGWLRDSTLHAVRLGDFEQQVVAAPAYLRRHGTPKQPEELATHDWLALTLLRSPLTWQFSGRDGELRTVRMRSRLRTDSSSSLRALAEAGAGITILDQFNAEIGLRSGALVRLLGGWSLPVGGVHAVYPSGRHVPAKVRAFIDFYAGYLQRERGAPRRRRPG